MRVPFPRNDLLKRRGDETSDVAMKRWLGAEPNERGEKRGTKRGTEVRFVQKLTGA